MIGEQLFAIAWGIDRSQLCERPRVKSASLGNSQVLPRDYQTQTEIETVIKEIGEQVAAQLRHHQQLAGFPMLQPSRTASKDFIKQWPLTPPTMIAKCPGNYSFYSAKVGLVRLCAI